MIDGSMVSDAHALHTSTDKVEVEYMVKDFLGLGIRVKSSHLSVGLDTNNPSPAPPKAGVG